MAYKPHQDKVVDYNQTNASQGKALTIYYKGSLADSNQVKPIGKKLATHSMTLHWGQNGWKSIADKLMIKRADGFWETTISVPIDASALDIDFTDGNNWDNNNQQDWHIKITDTSYNGFLPRQQ